MLTAQWVGFLLFPGLHLLIAYSSLQVHPVLFHIGPVVIPAYGAMAALGMLLALMTAQRTARIAGVLPGHMWNLCILALCAALAAQRLLLVVMNWSALRQHPQWMLGLAMIHHPLLAGAGALAGCGCALWYALSRRMPFTSTADALASPLALGLAFEQIGALMAGSGYGVDAGPHLPWAVTYTSPWAALWSGTPLGIPLHPVQAYAALAFLFLAILLFVLLSKKPRPGDAAGLWLFGAGMTIYMTELWRDPEGRGAVLHGALDGPQIAAAVMVLAGAVVMRERTGSDLPPFREERERMGRGDSLPPARKEREEMGPGESTHE
ncbi:MAG TPA: prolipoprotein diacylglyceryl transferase family protein [Terracidiphilus sp.]|nr:prolipoprotein diacylglyceryl transferase family protein [Terracidiphilus sp.]